MDSLTRWSIALGVGVFAGLGLFAGYHLATVDAQKESLNYAVEQLVPDRGELDVAVEFDTYDIYELSDFVAMVDEAGLEQVIDCGGYQHIGEVFHPAHGCTVDFEIPEALDLYDGTADVIRSDFSLTVGKYRSEYQDILLAADTVKVTTDAGEQNATFEGGHTFTLAFLERGTFNTGIEPWQFAVSVVPYPAIWLTVAAAGGIVTILATLIIRPRREEKLAEADTVGIEAFDPLFEDED